LASCRPEQSDRARKVARMLELRRAMEDTSSLRDWKVSVVRVVATGALTVLVLAVAGWPSGLAAAVIAAVVALLSFAFVLGAEFGWNLLMAPGRIATEERDTLREENAKLKAEAEDIESLKRLQDRERRLWEHQLAVARRAIAIQEVDIEIWGGAFREASEGHILPLPAILARRDVSLKARNIDMPLPELDLG
jgi:hypothetical protein